MRELLHKTVALVFWVLLVALWVLLIREGKAGADNIAYSVQYLAAVAGAVLAVTLWWIRHNLGIHRRKGSRSGRAAQPPRTDEDHLGRPLRWQVEGGAAGAVGVTHLVIELDGEAKVYSAGGAA